MLKKAKAVRTSLPRLEGHKLTQLTTDDLRRTVGAVAAEPTSGQSTLNCDDWCDCD
jgi:hypothetical protein